MFFYKPSGIQYHSRGDPATFDFNQAVLSTDGDWHDLDLSAIIPTGRPLVNLYVVINDSVVGASIKFRSKDITNLINIELVNILIADQDTHYSVMVQADAAGLISYWGSAIAFTKIDIGVCGWFV